MGIYWKNIDPEMQILGPTQQFIFNQNLNQFQFDNTFVPTSLVPSQNLFELRNSGLSGFRFRHETTFGDTHGALKIQSFLNGQTTGTDLITFKQDGTIDFVAPIEIPALVQVDGATQTFQYTGQSDSQFILSNTLAATSGNPSYVDLVFKNSTTGGFVLRHTSSITDTNGLGTLSLYSIDNTGAVGESFFTAVNGPSPILRIDGGLVVSDDIIGNALFFLGSHQLSMGGNVSFASSFSTVGNYSVTLTATANTAVTLPASGTLATLSNTLDQFAVPVANISLNSHKIINLATPTNSNDAATKSYVDSSVSGGVVTLSGAVTGSGNVGTTIITTLNPVTSITAVGTLTSGTWNASIISPVYGGTGVNNGSNTLTLQKNVVFNATSGTSITFLANGTTAVILPLSGTLATLSNSINDFALPSASINFNSQRLTFVGTPTTSTDAATKGYVDTAVGGTSPTTATYILQTANASLTNAQVLGSLSTGLLKNTTITGVLTIAAAGTDYYAPGSPTKLIDNASSQNISVGRNAFNNITTGQGNAIFGNSAIPLTTGGSNCIFGSNMAQSLTSGNSNVIMGAGAGMQLSSGSSNTLIGTSAGSNLTTPLFNVIIGVGAAGYLQTGGSNVAIGANAGYWNGVGFASYSNCVFLGLQTQPTSATLTNAVAIGAYASVNTNNSMVLGSGLNVGIGESSPTYAKLCLVGGVQNVTNEETIIRATSATSSAKIELNNTGSGGRLYELRSDSGDSSFNIVDRTSVINRLKIDSAGILNTYNNIVINNNFAYAPAYIQTGNPSDYLQIGYDITNDYSFINIAGSSNDRLAFRVNGTGIAALLSSGLFGLGTITPTAAKLQIVGGVQNIVGEDSAIRASSALSNVKIELQNTGASGKLYEIRSSSTGQFDITDRTGSATRFTISSAGNIGINMGLSTPNAPLQFSNSLVNRKIVLYETANNDHQYYGLGVNAASFRFQVDQTAAIFTFLAGLSSSSSQVAAQITGTGNIIIPGTYFGRSPSGTVYMEGNVTTTALTANVWAKIAGTTTASGFLNQFTSPVVNRLTYTGTSQIFALIHVSATLNFSAGLGSTRSIAIFKNGIQITPSLMSADSNLGVNINISTQAPLISLSTNDYIEVYCRSSVNTNVTASNLILTVTTT